MKTNKNTFVLLILVTVFLTACSNGGLTPGVITTAQPGGDFENEAEQAPSDGMIYTSLPSATSPPTETPTPAPTLPPVSGAVGERSIGDPYAPEIGNTGYDVQSYLLRMAIDPGVIFVEASVTIEAIAGLPDLSQISLDFIGFDIQSVEVDGKPATFTRQDDKLVLNLPEPVADGSQFSIDIRYQGEPVFEPSEYVPFISHLGLQSQTENRRLFVVAEPDGARYWYPNNDHPLDKATYRFELDVPEGLVGVANGTLVDTQKGVEGLFSNNQPADRYIWEHPYPMASALATIGIGDYVRVEGQPIDGIIIRHYVFPENEAAFQALQPTIQDMFSYMNEKFGAYPFEAFGFLQVAEQGASLETQTLVILGEGAGPTTMAHELVHMWIGDWVSLNTWGDMWRNEGLATYLAQAWQSESEATLDQQMESYAKSIEADPSGFPLNNPPRSELFGRDSYYKGAVVYHALRKEMGDQAFFQGLRTYLRTYGGDTATQEQFQAVMESAAGKPLGDFFAKWFK